MYNNICLCIKCETTNHNFSFSAAKLLHHPQRVTAQTWAERMGQGWGINIHHNSHPQIPKQQHSKSLEHIYIYFFWLPHKEALAAAAQV